MLDHPAVIVFFLAVCSVSSMVLCGTLSTARRLGARKAVWASAVGLGFGLLGFMIWSVQLGVYLLAAL